MGVHESSVNYRNLIRDLAEMYPFEVSDVVIVELVANALDAKPSNISIDFDPMRRTLVVADDGIGMSASDFDQYHDFAAGLKLRGTGIGFAGVGAKISFNIAAKVVTETRSASFAGGSNWYLDSRNRLLWDDFTPARVQSHGTRVEVFFDKNAKLTYTNSQDVRQLLLRHYLPLLCEEFLQVYDQLGYYSGNLRFVVDGKVVAPMNLKSAFKLQNFREFFPKRSGKRIGYGVLGLAESEYPVARDVSGVLLSTHGKVIKADLFNQFPGHIGPRIVGLVEIPEFVNYLTTSKTDFIRRPKHADFERLYDPVRQQFKSWLADLGMEPVRVAGTDEAAKLERELKRLLDDVPELGDFFGFRASKNVLQPRNEGTILAQISEGVESTFPDGEGEAGEGQAPLDIGEAPGQALIEESERGTQRANPISRKARRGPKITFVEAPDRIDLAWVDGNYITVNTGHPSYARVRSDSKSARLHNLFAVACAVQKFLANDTESEALTFPDRMMSAWGKK